MKQVTQNEFFAALYADKRDIMPNQRNPDHTDWEVVATRSVWGRTLPGWKDSGNPNVPKSYFLAA